MTDGAGPLQVHHMVVENSVEENVRRLNEERAAQLPGSSEAAARLPARAENQGLSLRCLGRSSSAAGQLGQPAAAGGLRSGPRCSLIHGLQTPDGVQRAGTWRCC